jgi:large subunit ribosomal protein L37Ae
MSKTKKVGITGRYGARYGSTVRKRVKKLEDEMHSHPKCPKCVTQAVVRKSVGVWYCKKCEAEFTGGAYRMETQRGIESKRIAKRKQRELEIEE